MNPQSLADKLDKKVCDLWLVANNYREGTPGWNTYNDLIKLLTEAAAEVRGGGWVSVEERLPEDGEHVLTYGAKDAPFAVMVREFSCWGTMEWMIHTPTENVQSYPPTHWQPLPSPPGAVGEGHAIDKAGGECEPVAWLICYAKDGQLRQSVFTHNAIADYRDIDPAATVWPLYAQPPRASEAGDCLYRVQEYMHENHDFLVSIQEYEKAAATPCKDSP